MRTPAVGEKFYDTGEDLEGKITHTKQVGPRMWEITVLWDNGETTTFPIFLE